MTNDNLVYRTLNEEEENNAERQKTLRSVTKRKPKNCESKLILKKNIDNDEDKGRYCMKTYDRKSLVMELFFYRSEVVSFYHKFFFNLSSSQLTNVLLGNWFDKNLYFCPIFV